MLPLGPADAAVGASQTFCGATSCPQHYQQRQGAHVQGGGWLKQPAPWGASQPALQGCAPAPLAALAPLAAAGLALLLLLLAVQPLVQQHVLPSAARLQHLGRLLVMLLQVLPCRLKPPQQTPCACSALRP